MNRPTAALVLGLVLLSALGGCLDRFGLGALTRPNYPVSRTALKTTDGWNTDSTFVVEVLQAAPVAVTIEARPDDGGAPLGAQGTSNATTPVTLQIPDGTWTVSYTVGGHAWETFKGARFDTTPPTITGLDTVLDAAADGSATIGAGATVEAGATVSIVDQSTGRAIGQALPLQLTGLADGVHAYDVVASDEAGNEDVSTVQVLAGSATQLPAPHYTAGIVARYTTTLRLWDLTDLAAYDSPAAAQAAAPGELGSGTGLTPNDPDVQAVVQQVVKPGMTTAEAALALYHWMFDHLDYNESRLDDDNLLSPAQTLQAHGGVCRDLAALYVSLLRGAGVPSRLVTGYLAGRVNGFHAWAEFYGGIGPSPWVPVDVSGIDGPFDQAGMLQTFGIALPEHLPLRALTPSEEQTDWSSAATLGYTAPAGSPAPDAPFKKDLTVEFEQTKALCINESTRERHVASSGAQCKESFIPNFAAQAARVLDYGVQVGSAARGTTIQLSLVYPDAAGASPDAVEFRSYLPPAGSGLKSSGFHQDPSTGRDDTELKA